MRRIRGEPKSRVPPSQSITLKKTGVRKMPKRVTPSMPLNTAVPRVRRISAPAPRAINSGSDAEDERRRGHDDRPQAELAGRQGGLASRRAFLALVLGELHDEDGILAGQPHQHHEADLREDVDVGRAAARHATWARAAGIAETPTIAHSRHMGTTRITAKGSDQLSYCAASTRKTINTATAKMAIAVLPACTSKKAISVHS